MVPSLVRFLAGSYPAVQWFPNVEIERRNGILVVAEAAPLAEYVMSHAQLANEGAIKLHDHFDRQIQVEGALRINAQSRISKAA